MTTTIPEVPTARYRRLAAALLGLSLAACTATTPEPATAPPPPPPPAEEGSGKLSEALQWMRNSAEYEALLIQTYHLAGERLEELVAGREPGSWAVALDADETVLDNSQFTLEGELSGEGYDRARWEEWVRRREATAVPGALGFLHRVRELGGRIAIVTNRSVADCPDTEANLRALGAPLDVILCRAEDGRKESRWRQVEEGTAAPGLPPAEIVLWVGDNIKDFPGLDQDLRFEDEEAFDRFGVEYFIVPNPTYGSWEYNPDRSEE